jgi:hypothetical protein
MIWDWFHKANARKKPEKKDTSMAGLLKQAKKSSDFIHYRNTIQSKPFWVSYFHTVINPDVLHRDILTNLTKDSLDSLKQLKTAIPVEDILITKDVDEIQNKLYKGHVMIQLHEYDQKCLLIPAAERKSRQVGTAEIEFSVLGPKEAFVEDLDTNINLIRQRLPVPQLAFKELLVGKLSKTKVVVVYIDGIASDENVNTAVQRLREIEFDNVVDTSILQQMISDNTHSIFPVTTNSEKPDDVVGMLGFGKLAILSEGSSQAILAPSSFFESFLAREDYFMPWLVASALRLVRFFAVLFSVLITPLYVAVLTYHYEMVPQDLLGTLISSRVIIPFPPYVEALFLELTIELLREAGARLPTKVGQTLGIVGGIVIGQAAVAAGLTSNVLLILVALAALASFTTPNYKMANTIRLLRFPFILCAAFWGGLGVVFCFSFFLIHLLRLTSLGRPYLHPFYPPRFRDLSVIFIRSPLSHEAKRPSFLQPEDSMRFNPKRAKEKHDIDE